jgi:flavin reductase (DIM6/NTAB) family NADH-FMN oxidoreductase RutF
MTVDRDTFRRLRSAFPTGVTVITTVAGDGEPRGLTLQAFVAVSTEPPLILVSLEANSRTLVAIRDHGAFVVNFLSEGREQLSNRFASKEEEKFAGVNWRASHVAKGSPILTADVVAYAECHVAREIDGGDHQLFLGMVVGGEFLGGRPLMYYRRTYAAWPEGKVIVPTPAPDAWRDYTDW